MRIFARLAGMLLGTIGMILNFYVVYQLYGFIGMFIGAILFPITMLVTPWYVLFHSGGNPTLLLLTYGGSILWVWANSEPKRKTAHA